MRINPLRLPGAFVVDDEPTHDHRGSFGRIFCNRELGDLWGTGGVVQASISVSRSAGTLRGLHFQWPPAEEHKLVRCIRGSIFDVVLDLRPRSATFLRSEAICLEGSSGRSVLIPKGCAHGFLTLQDDCELLYMMSEFHSPETSAGVRWDDPAFGIPWPEAPRLVSARDRGYADFDAAAHEREYFARGAGGAVELA